MSEAPTQPGPKAPGPTQPSVTASTPAARRRLLSLPAQIALAALAFLIIAGAVATWMLAKNAASIVRDRVAAVATHLGKRIGRTITVGPARVTFALEIAVEIEGLTVAAAPGQTGPAALPLVHVEAIRVGVGAWPLVRSLGKELAVRHVDVVRPEITAVRLADGRMSYADVAARLAVPDASAPDDALERAALERAVITRAAISSGALRFHDLSSAPQKAAAIEAIEVVALDLHPGAPLAIAIDGAAFGTARNVHVDVTLTPGPDAAASGARAASLEASATEALGRLRHVMIKVRSLEIAPVAGFLPRSGGHGVARAKVDADLSIAVAEGAVRIDLAGAMGATGIVLVHPVQPAKGAHTAPASVDDTPVDARMHAAATIDPAAATIEVASFDVTVGDTSASGRAALKLHTRAADGGLEMELRTLRLAAFGGTLDASGSSVSLGPAPAPFTLAAKLERLGAASMLAAIGGTADATGDGQINATVAVEGTLPDSATNATWLAAAKGFTGKVAFELREAHLKPKKTIAATIVDPLLAAIAHFAGGIPVSSIDMTVSGASAAFHVAGGKLATTAPMRVTSAAGGLSVTGTVGFDKTLALNGSFDVLPSVIEKATGGIVSLADSVRIGLSVGGTLDQPVVAVAGIETSLSSLARSGLRGIAKKIERVLGP